MRSNWSKAQTDSHKYKNSSKETSKVWLPISNANLGIPIANVKMIPLNMFGLISNANMMH